MGTTAQKLQYLVDAKASIDAALTAKGVTPPAAFGDYGNAIANIPSGGSNKLPQVLDNSVTELTADDLAGCTKIGEYAFYNCAGLTSVTIPDSVTSIGEYAFYNCAGLTSVTIEATTPPVLGSTNAFTSTRNYPIYVPAASVEAYKAATNWSKLASRIFAIQE